MVKGSYDFVGLAHRTTYTATGLPLSVNCSMGYYCDQRVQLGVDLSYPNLAYRPQEHPNDPHRLMGFGVRDMLMHVKDQYSNPTVVVESGLSDCGTMTDQGRVEYLRDYIDSTRLALGNGSRVMGFMVDSLVDGFDW